MSCLLPVWESAAITADVAAATTDRAGLAARQQRRLARLLRAAVQGSALYRQLYAPWLQAGQAPGSLPLQELPVVHKRQLMARFADWVTDPALALPALRRFTSDPARIAEPWLGRYTVWESSGSSGEPALFVQDAQAMAVYDALEALRRPQRRPWMARCMDPLGLAERLVFLGATSGHFASTVSLERLRHLHPTLAASVHSLSFLQPADTLVRQLHALDPTVVATYPTAAVLLAEEQAAGRLAVSPREVWTGGETLTPGMRRFIEANLRCQVANSYGSSEFLALAGECAQGRLHVNADWVLLEPVDGAGQPVPLGHPSSSVLLTHLANTVQPLIRYDLGDRVTLHAAATCGCGSALPVIEVQGREDDCLILPARHGGHPVRLLSLALSTVLEDDAGLFDFQLLQASPQELRLSTGASGPAARASLQRARQVLRAFIDGQGGLPPHLSCRSGTPGRRGRSGKIPRIVRL